MRSILYAIALATACVQAAGAQGARNAVATTPAFRFHSDPLVGLHDFLNWRTSGLDSAPTDSCPAMAGEQRVAFERAWQTYASKRGRERNRFIIAMHYEVAGFPGLDIIPDTITAPALSQLKAALPAYQLCWWSTHDARNRAWIAELIPRLHQHEEAIRTRLARAYQAEWDGQIPVDVVSFATGTGAYTVTRPHHIMISAVDSSYRGNSALEMIFHEASHTIVDSGRDIIRRVLNDATVVGSAATPRDLSHVLLFYTAGRLTQDRLAETGTGDYRPYLYREGLFERAWPQYRRPIERHWQPYLDGQRSAADAIRAIVDELRGRPRDDRD